MWDGPGHERESHCAAPAITSQRRGEALIYGWYPPARAAPTARTARRPPSRTRGPSCGPWSGRWLGTLSHDLKPSFQVEARAHDDVVKVDFGEGRSHIIDPGPPNRWTPGTDTCRWASSTTTPVNPSSNTFRTATPAILPAQFGFRLPRGTQHPGRLLSPLRQRLRSPSGRIGCLGRESARGTRGAGV